MGLLGDLGKGLKKVGGGGLDLLEKGGKAVIDEDAWSDALHGRASMSDWANIALDSSMLIPGAGLVGGAARVGTRGALKVAAREGEEALARKAVVNSLRSPINREIRGAADDGLKAVKKGLTRKPNPRKNLDDWMPGGRAARQTAKNPLDSQIGRIAAKKEAGVGTKVGFGQSRKRILRNAALTGGANLFQDAYDRGVFGDIFGPGDDGDNSAKASQGKGGPGGGMYLVGSDGSQVAVPAGFMDALAAFMQQNGTVDGEQVIYNK